MKDQAQKVDITKKVDAVATEKHPVYKKGDQFQCGIITKENLINKGFVVDDRPKAAKEEKAADK